MQAKLLGLLFLFLVCFPTDICGKLLLKAATYELPQQALTDGVTRYHDLIDYALENLNAIPLPYYSGNDGGHCHDSWMIDGTRATKQLSIVPNTLKISIESGGIRVTARAKFWIYAPGYFKTSGRIAFGWCWHHTVCSGTVGFDTEFDINCLFTFTPSNGILVIGSRPVPPNVNNWNVHGCDSIPHWLDWLLGITDKINDAIGKACTKVAEELTREYSVPPEVQIGEQIVLKYYVNTIAFEAGQRVRALLDAEIVTMVNNTDGSGYHNVTFDYGDFPNGDIYPPYDWQEKVEDRYLLNGVRVNGLVLQIIIGAENSINAFNQFTNFNIDDAKLYFSYTMSQPVVDIIAENTISMQIDSAIVYGTCGEQVSTETLMFQAEVYNVTANGTMISVSQDYSPGFYIHTNSVDLDKIQVFLDAPPLPLPPSLIKYFVDSEMNSMIDLMNKIAASYPFIFPARDALYVPNAVLYLNQTESGYDYIELASYCTCGSSDNIYIPCQFLCSTSKTTQNAEQKSLQSTSEGLYIAKFDAGIYAIDPDYDCGIDVLGASATIFYMNDTLGECVSISSSTSSEDNAKDSFTYYYSLDSNSAQKSVRLMCLNSDCTNCEFVSDDLKLNECYKADNQSYSLSFQTSFECFKSSVQYNEDNIYYLEWDNTDSCSFQNASMFSMTNFGTSGTCIQYGDDDTFWRITQQSNSSQYTIEMNCDAGCQTCETTVIQDTNTCYSGTSTNDGQAVISYMFYDNPQDYGIFCHTVEETHDGNGLTYLLFLLFLPFLICAISVLWRGFRKAKMRRQRKWVAINETPSGNVLVFEQRSRMKELLEWIQGTFFYFKCCIWDLKARFKFQKQDVDLFLLLLFVALCSEAFYLVAWIESPPFELYETFNSSDISLPSGMIDSSRLEHAFETWEYFAKATTYFGVGGIALCIFVKLFIVLDANLKLNLGIWQLIAIMILRFGIMIIPNLAFIVHKLVVIYPGYSKFLDDNQDIKQVLESLVGFIITGLGFGYLACWYLFVTHCLPMACYTATLFCILRNKITDTGMHLSVIANFIICFVSNVCSVVPIIILYQTLSVSFLWLISWAVYSCIQLVLLFFFQSIAHQHERYRGWEPPDLIKEHLTTYKKMQRNKLILMLCYVFVWIVQTGLSTALLYKGTSFASINPFFPLAVCISTFITTCVLTFMLYSEEIAPTTDYDEHQPFDMDNVELDEVGNPIIEFVKEKKEKREPKIFGERIDNRRMFLFVGFCFFTYLNVQEFTELRTMSVEEAFKDLCGNLNIDMDWPKTNSTIFDKPFAVYQEASWIKFWFEASANIFFFIAIVLDLSSFHIKWSRLCVLLGVAALFIGTIIPTTPNYLENTDLTDICPSCAPKFDRLVRMLSGYIVGIFTATFFTAELGMLLFTLVPALVRSCALVIYSIPMHRRTERYNVRVRILWKVFAFSACTVVAMTALPVVMAVQLLGDGYFTILLSGFWLLPLSIALFAYVFRKHNYVLTSYMTYTCFYLLTLLAVFAYEFFMNHGSWGLIRSIVQEPEIWISLAADTLLASVACSDMIFALMLPNRDDEMFLQ